MIPFTQLFRVEIYNLIIFYGNVWHRVEFFESSLKAQFSKHVFAIEFDLDSDGIQD